MVRKRIGMAENELQRLLPRHFRMLDLCLQGLSRNDIALVCGVTPESVGLVINSPLFQDELARRRQGQYIENKDKRTLNEGEALDILQKASAKAANRHVELLDSDNERTVQASANAILDRVLAVKGSEVGAVKIDQTIINLLQITVNELKGALIESKAPPVERSDVEVG